MNNCEQVIRREGKIIRLIPANKFPIGDAVKCPRVFITSDGCGFYRETGPEGVQAFDVSHLWSRTHDH